MQEHSLFMCNIPWWIVSKDGSIWPKNQSCTHLQKRYEWKLIVYHCGKSTIELNNRADLTIFAMGEVLFKRVLAVKNNKEENLVQ